MKRPGYFVGIHSVNESGYWTDSPPMLLLTHLVHCLPYSVCHTVQQVCLFDDKIMLALPLIWITEQQLLEWYLEVVSLYGWIVAGLHSIDFDLLHSFSSMFLCGNVNIPTLVLDIHGNDFLDISELAHQSAFCFNFSLLSKKLTPNTMVSQFVPLSERGRGAYEQSACFY